MNTNKTIPTRASVTDFLEKIADRGQQEDSFWLVQMMQEVTGEPPVLWGPSIIGFGSYHYRYDSGREGDMPLVGFSPRKGKIALYIGATSVQNQPLLDKLGRHSTGKSCLYITHLEDIDKKILRRIIVNTLEHRTPDELDR